MSGYQTQNPKFSVTIDPALTVENNIQFLQDTIYKPSVYTVASSTSTGTMPVLDAYEMIGSYINVIDGEGTVPSDTFVQLPSGEDVLEAMKQLTLRNMGNQIEAVPEAQRNVLSSVTQGNNFLTHILNNDATSTLRIIANTNNVRFASNVVGTTVVASIPPNSVGVIQTTVVDAADAVVRISQLG